MITSQITLPKVTSKFKIIKKHQMQFNNETIKKLSVKRMDVSAWTIKAKE